MAKNIIICCDGTNNQFGSVNTNVVRLFQSVVKSSPEQAAFYDPGVGTFAAKFFSFNVGVFLGKLLGSAFGYGVKKNLETCYRYVMDTYEDGDQVYIFGFSRGAFTARSLAAMLDKCGLLHTRHQNMIPYMSRQYFGKKSDQEVSSFKETFCRECNPYFVGVWDTVGALGWLKSFRKFSDNKLSPKVKFAFHALSIDEKRKKFVPTLWDEGNIAPGQTIEQMWFAGVHSDVGGGYPNHALADVAFTWLVNHAVNKGLNLIPGSIDDLKGSPLGVMHNSMTSFWPLLGSVDREIPGNAKIHASVWERYEKDESYRPRNLPLTLKP